MKVLSSLLVLCLLAYCVLAQAVSPPSTAPNIKVIQKKWRTEVQNPAATRDPVSESDNSELEARQRREIELLNEKLRAQGMPTRDIPARQPRPDPEPFGLSLSYIYEIRLQNTGPREIRSITWEYVFLDPETEQEVGRRQFESEITIAPGRTRNIVARSATPPTGTVDASEAGKRSTPKFTEQIVIQSITYADGTTWDSPCN
jgi:hypothetical protein